LIGTAAKSTEKKKGIEKIKLNTASKNENSNAPSLKRIFFSKIEAVAESTADNNASMNHVIENELLVIKLLSYFLT
jgi:hypothetical protein